MHIRGISEAAIDQATPGFGIAFQPIVDVGGRRILAQEALVRGLGGGPAAGVLNRVEGGQRFGLEIAIARHALARAVALGIGTDVHVNVSPGVLLHAPDVLGAIAAVAEAERFPLARLVLEVTEGERIDDPPRLRQAVEAARRLGIRIAIDDFGAGYNGLSLLAEVQPDIIKIDMTLTRGIDLHRVRRSIVAGILRMVEPMGLRVIAEGVESVGELGCLHALGITEMQGFLFAHPIYERAPAERELRLPFGTMPSGPTRLEPIVAAPAP
ncbi:EAL domain-containing protein [Elioraea sp.]|jgi:EAL domain-containing protein (putative c-di-GMP-specific phosphodiesterase class I)|uniref:EAL domain-containing protein n=1 Tax=Elioraea sp. TaxID=2185103 RepID=UPI0021DC4E6D|nr:EAL domain-containing protein [Elioraea sp.]GIX08790.1 MAG: diguanylate phosphodiesterase [Elioraea sp.]